MKAAIGSLVEVEVCEMDTGYHVYRDKRNLPTDNMYFIISSDKQKEEHKNYWFVHGKDIKGKDEYILFGVTLYNTNNMGHKDLITEARSLKGKLRFSRCAIYERKD